MSRKILLPFSLLLAALLDFQTAFATHNRAGEIICEQVDCSELTLRCTIITYTKTSSVPADRDTLTLCWGDGTCDQVPRSNGNGEGEPLPNDVKFNTYIATHTFPGRGTYQITMTDPNRNGGIVNVNPPGSDMVQFHLKTTYTFLNPQFQGCNNTPVLLQPPVDFACVGQPFLHNPNAYDPDGDSLSYRLVVPFQDINSPVPNYTFPDQVAGNGCCLELNEITGDLIWTNPQVKGEYNIAMIIVSWRNGIPIDTVLRDMQIFVEDCEDNLPPVIDTEDFLCVVAGDVVEFDVVATDPNPENRIKLSALGGPFSVSVSPADDAELWRPFGNPSAHFEPQPVVRTFRWQTTCEHIQQHPYTVIFKAEDDIFDSSLDPEIDTAGLATLRTVRIKVVGPPPADVQADADRNSIKVSWAKPYECEDAADDYFFGFSVWRREGSNQFPIDTCTPGLAGRGYVEIVQNTQEVVGGRYYFEDTDVERGRTYCYRILAKFARRTGFEPSQPYNIVESLPSEEVCMQLTRDVPLLTKVSVEQTSPVNGVMQVEWVKPDPDDLDTLQNPGPYRIQLQRGRGFTDSDFTPVPGADFSSPTFWQLSADSFTDLSLNTEEQPYTYRLAFFVNGESEPLGFSPPASSIFLSIASTDETNNLSWESHVPWGDSLYTVYRFNDALAQWVPIASVTQPSYADTGLVNGRTYCYYIEALSSYGVEGIPSPLVNLSQEACGVPLDTIPPCPPELSVRTICDEDLSCEEQTLFENDLRWVNPMELCETTDDVVGYRIYFSPRMGGELELIAEVDSAGITTFTHELEQSLAGCYAVTAIDTFLNESDFSPLVCVENCPRYQLPNTFTPNQDGFNDLFVPRLSCFIERVDMKIFNVWGQLVYQTEDPNINWDGTNLKGEPLPQGTYYYVAKIFGRSVEGVSEVLQPLKGHIDLVRDLR